MSIIAPATALWTCDDGSIRVTAAGQPSVFDMIKVLGGQKNPKQVWLRLKESNPEVVPKCDHLKFPGPGQRETPVARTKEDAYYILGLLPGAAGRKYREQAAQLFSAFLTDPASVAAAAVARMSGDEKDWLEARLSGKRTRHTFSDNLKDAGVQGYGYAACTNAVYEPVLGADAKTLKQQRNLPTKSSNLRDNLTLKELTDLEAAERIAVGQIKRTGARGNLPVERVVRHTSEYTRQLLDGAITIPGLSS